MLANAQKDDNSAFEDISKSAELSRGDETTASPKRKAKDNVYLKSIDHPKSNKVARSPRFRSKFRVCHKTKCC